MKNKIIQIINMLRGDVKSTVGLSSDGSLYELVMDVKYEADAYGYPTLVEKEYKWTKILDKELDN